MSDVGDMMGSGQGPRAYPNWFGQPRGLTVLFLTEMWEIFSYYGMRALLVLYMTKHLMIAQEKASWIYGLYTAGVYLTPPLGGYLADRWLGRRNAVVLGGLIMAAGHFMMAFEPAFYVALATIAIGNGLFLPSLPSQIDALYEKDDPRRKSAYNIYYVGINIGAFLAPLVCGTLGESLGFHWGFGAAGVGMLLGLVIYVAGGRYLPPDIPRRQARVAPSLDPLPKKAGGGLFRRFSLLLGIAACVVIFRGAYEQIGNTISLWADTAIDRRVTDAFSIPTTWFQSFNPFLVFTLTPLFVARWTRLAAKQREASSVIKMTIGAALVGLSYLAIGGLAAWAAAGDFKLSWLWLTAFMVVMTAGELYILPVGLGLFGRLAPQGLNATTIATWFFAGFAGNLFAGWLGSLWTPLSHSQFFLVIGAVGLASAVALRLIAPIARPAEAAI